MRPPLVFIGMPCSGKTTIGRLTAARLGMPFLDFDEEIERRKGMTVQELFALLGEEGFRQLETGLARELSGKRGLVISPGGGIVERPENMALLKPGAVICRLERDLSLIDTTGRPLLQKPGAAQELAARREPLYKKYADFTLSNNSTPEECAGRVTERYLEICEKL